MSLIPTTFSELFIFKGNKNEDGRGSFSRILDIDECKGILTKNIVQTSISRNNLAGTIRGMHMQIPPFEEWKIVSCIKGSIHDVVIDVRKDSKNYSSKFEIILTENDPLSLIIPPGFLHGFQTLQDNTIVLYNMCEIFDPRFAVRFSHKSPIFNINWQLSVTSISELDETAPIWQM